MPKTISQRCQCAARPCLLAASLGVALLQLAACSTGSVARLTPTRAPAASPISEQAALFPTELLETDALAFSDWAPEYSRRADLLVHSPPATPFNADAWPASARPDLNSSRRLTLPHRPETIIYFNTPHRSSRPEGWWRHVSW